jgi:hypothetical protein
MADIDSLPADQRAALQLLLKQGQTYDQLASLLGIGPDAVRSRAHVAVDTLGPDTDLPDADRAAIADYLLGQQAVSERDATRDLLAGSEAAQDWARAAAGSLIPLAGDALPEIPSGEAAAPEAPPEPEAPAYEEPEAPVYEEPEAPVYEEPAPPPEPERPAYEEPVYAEPEPAAYEEAPAEEAAPTERRAPSAPARPSSRLGGALLLGGLGIIVAVVLILIINGGGDDSSKKGANTLSTNPSTQTTPNGQQRPIAQVNLTSASGNSRQVGLAQVFENGSRRAIIVAGQGLDPGAYALWLYNSASDAKLLGFVPERVGKDGRFATQGELPSNAEKYKQLVVTQENVTNDTKKAPSSPGDVVLEGNLKLG